ncbi:lysR substrate binding domain-containing protein [Ditylenchus destructor]|uniref:LysR substrate binding domain-containing protein n=1 Tax=Ditylenchus destructor TaxID=166010 RepID=A0AAD4QW38_9BILA|nr:lysR substrate binding domain-containing protein [Ditylenchus destructor]
MAQFRREWPRVTFEVHTHHHDDLVRSLIGREIDLAIAYTPPPHPRLTHQVLAEGELGVLYPDKMFAPAGDRFPLDLLADRAVIGVAATGPIGDVLTRAARERGALPFARPYRYRPSFIAARLAQLEAASP